MVAVIKFSSSLRNVLNYNENKLKQKKAQLIHAAGYAKDVDKLGFTDKFKRLQKQVELNERSKKPVVHISLNFDSSEKLSHDKLKAIADSYMQKIGLGNQPYLVYQHHDAGHPHIHVVSTLIQDDGSRIKTHNIGRFQSETARKQIETDFGLVKADHRQRNEVFQLKAINAQRVQYGKSETKRAITNVLDAVVDHYKYTSLAELNAVLRCYNVTADRGSEESRIYKSNGLVYRVLDEKGNKVGVPIPASHIYNKPTLKFLEQKFTANQSLREPHKQRIKNAIELAFARHEVRTVTDLESVLRKEKIQLVIRQNEEGTVYGLTYVDPFRKTVFNGSDLGKPYSANAILERCGRELNNLLALDKEFRQTENSSVQKQKRTREKTAVLNDAEKRSNTLFPLDKISDQEKTILQELTDPMKVNETIPYGLKQKRKRKRKRLHL